MNIRLLTSFFALSAFANTPNIWAQSRHNEATDETVDRCDDVASGFCSQATAGRDYKQSGQELANELKQALTESVNNIHGKGPLEAARTALERQGFVLKDGLNPEEIQDALLPYYLQGNVIPSPDQGHIRPQQVSHRSPFKKFELCEWEPNFFAEIKKDEARAQALKIRLGKIQSTLEAELNKDQLPPVSLFDRHSPAQTKLIELYDNWDRPERNFKAEFASAYIQNVLSTNSLERVNRINRVRIQETRRQINEIAELKTLCRMLDSAGHTDTSKDAIQYCQTPYPFRDRHTITGKELEYQELPIREAISDARTKLINVYSIGVVPNFFTMAIFEADDSGDLTKSKVNQQLKNLSEKIFTKQTDGTIKATPEKAEIYIDQYIGAQLAVSGWKEMIFKDFESQSTTQYVTDDELRTRGLCEALDKVYWHQIESIRSSIFNNVQKTKSVITSVSEKLYPEEIRIQQQAIFNDAKRRMNGIVGSTVGRHMNNEKRQKLTQSIETLKMHQPISIEKLRFKHDENLGVDVLDMDELDEGETHYSHFEDPALSGFLEVNAFFQTERTLGDVKIEKSVYVFPGLLRNFRDQPMGIYSVVAHEIGHSVGPQISKLNGYDLKRDWKSVLDCLARKDSISMGQHQHDECIADWISAETVASYINDPPRPPLPGFPNEPKQIALQAIAPLCAFQKDELPDDRKGRHPGTRKRINGVFGSHPTIRKALGCSSQGPYPYCSFSSSQEKKQ